MHVYVIRGIMETLKSFLVLGITVWVVYRVFILVKRLVKGWGKNGR